MPGMGRRQFVGRMTSLAAATWGATVWRPGLRLARAQTAGRVVDPSGTTLESLLLPVGDGPYLTLTPGPGLVQVVREELATGQVGRESRRTALGSIVHLTDVHIVDTQSPARVEFLDRDADPPQGSIPFGSAWRAHETLTAHVSEAMVQRVRQIANGPVTGRAFDVCVSTGDNIDNQQRNELQWFIDVLDGNEVAPNSGDPDRYEGVQDTEAAFYDEHYWHPDEVAHPVSGEPDLYKRRDGFPSLPGLLEAAIRPFVASGIGLAWYSAYGNHDGLLQGNAPQNDALQAIATGPLKVVSRPGLTTGDLQSGFDRLDPTVLAAALSGPGRPVTADPDRAFVSPVEWIQAHLDSATAARAGGGHGYTQDNLDAGTLYYTFPIAEEILGICLDTINRGGYAEGSIGRNQFDWVAARLAEVHARHHDDAGNEVATGNDDRLVILFSHHNLATMDNPSVGPAETDLDRVMGPEVEAMLHRYPNVIAWVNGHSHVNRVWARPDPTGRSGGFWEVNTAAHCDWPLHARIVEVVDNADGTLSIFGTLVEHAGPASGASVDGGVLALASISRELALNDLQVDAASAQGQPIDGNVELLLRRPFERVGGSVAPVAPGDDEPTPQPLPATGGGLALGAVAVATAAVLARRSSPPPQGQQQPRPAVPPNACSE